MKISNHTNVPVYTISGSSTARPLPEWLARKRKRSLKSDPEYASRIELLQDFEFEEASQCVRVSDDGQWVMSTGTSWTAMYACLLSTMLIPLVFQVRSLIASQGPISLRYTRTTYLICHSPLLAIPSLSIPPSSYCPQTTPSPYTYRQIVPSNFTPLLDATILLGSRGMGEISSMISDLRKR